MSRKVFKCYEGYMHEDNYYIDTAFVNCGKETIYFEGTYFENCTFNGFTFYKYAFKKCIFNKCVFIGCSIFEDALIRCALIDTYIPTLFVTCTLKGNNKEVILNSDNYTYPLHFCYYSSCWTKHVTKTKLFRKNFSKITDAIFVSNSTLKKCIIGTGDSCHFIKVYYNCTFKNCRITNLKETLFVNCTFIDCIDEDFDNPQHKYDNVVYCNCLGGYDHTKQDK